MDRTYLVECYWPGVTTFSCAEAMARAGEVAQAMRAEGREIRFLDGLLLLTDEVAFYRFASPSTSDVEQACARARLPYERISEYIALPAAPVDMSEPGWETVG